MKGSVIYILLSKKCPLIVSMEAPKETAKEAYKRVHRCNGCRRKKSILLACRCSTLIANHQWCTSCLGKHVCSFDYKAAAKAKLKDELKPITASKLLRL
jgi:hypothetical protein